MDKAPKRIWVQNDTKNHKDELDRLGIKPVLEATTCFQEYTRTDISNALIAAAYEAAAGKAEARYDLCERDNVGECKLRKCAIGRVVRALTPSDARAAYDAAIRAAKIKGMREAKEACDSAGDFRAADAITALIEETEKGGE